MRAELLTHLSARPDLRGVDDDFVHLFASWFNRGFLVLRPIDWTTPANILERIIRYEAVHEINGWNDLRNRLEPSDRRCFGFFHPQLVDDPLIFVEVALTTSIPGAIPPLLATDRVPNWAFDPVPAEAVRKVMITAAASYFLRAKTARGQPIDPVARFHLGNGARLERVNFLGDPSPKGMKQSHGLMVNYLYDLNDIER